MPPHVANAVRDVGPQAPRGLLPVGAERDHGLPGRQARLSTPMAVVAGVFHIINHATFKAALFMNAGAVDHEAGTRDIRRLGGLAGLMPVAASVCT